MSQEPENKTKRKRTIYRERAYTRYEPDPGTLARIDAESLTGDFKPTLVGLVYEEAYKGCGLVLLATNRMLVGDKVRVQVGEIGPLVAEVRWRNPVETRVIMVGLLFLD